MKALLLSLTILFTHSISAQNKTNMIPGEYYLEGVHEVGSGFRFNTDGTFDFFFSYGAMDRAGKGNWKVKGDSLILNSPRKPATDFLLAESGQTADSSIIIQVTDPNPNVLRYVLCRVTTETGFLEGHSDEAGRIVLEKAPVREIALLHEIWPDRPSVFAIADPSLNTFTFTILPTIADMEFNELVLKIEDEHTLTGAHPLLGGEEMTYKKED